MITFLSIIAALVALVALWLLAMAGQTQKLARNAERLVPPPDTFVSISTGHVAYSDDGPKDAQPVLMVHGLGGQMRSLTMSLVPLLAEDFRVIAIDRPGMGYSDRPESAPADIAAQAGYVEEVIDALGLTRPIVLGHSLGGAISAGLALRAPEKVGALALIAPLLVPSTKSVAAFSGLAVTKPWLRRLIAQTIAVPASVKNAPLGRAEIFGPEAVPDSYDIAGGGQLTFRPKSFFNTSRDYVSVPVALPAQSKRYGEITCPVIVLYGDEDRILSVEEQGRGVAQRYAHFELREIAGAGHMLPITRADDTAKVVRDLAAKL